MDSQKVIEGALKFMEEDFYEHKKLFENLANSQKPHTLFIGCVDSRVVPNLITNSMPGELFVVRNIANIVPPYRISQDHVSTTAAIEYALYSLNIKHIIICGHSNCGGCEALYYPKEKMQNLPNVQKWLNILDPIKKEVEKSPDIDKAKRSWLTERLNIINSIKNLFTFPNVKQEFDDGKIKIYGWHYIIETGELYDFDIKSKHFKLLQKDGEYEKIYNELFADM